MFSSCFSPSSSSMIILKLFIAIFQNFIYLSSFCCSLLLNPTLFSDFPVYLILIRSSTVPPLSLTLSPSLSRIYILLFIDFPLVKPAKLLSAFLFRPPQLCRVAFSCVRWIFMVKVSTETYKDNFIQLNLFVWPAALTCFVPRCFVGFS